MAENGSEKNGSASSRRTSRWGDKTPRSAPSLCSGNCQGLLTGTTLLSGQLPAARVCCQGRPITRNCHWGQASVPKNNLLFYLIPDWWWDPGNSRSHSSHSLLPLPSAQCGQHRTPDIGHAGSGCPASGSFSHKYGAPSTTGSLPLGTSQEPLRAEAGPRGRSAR